MKTIQEILLGIQTDLPLNDRYIQDAETVKHDYLILFNGRTGSSWLTSVLSGHLGNPEEYLNPEFLRDVAIRAGSDNPRKIMLGLRGLTQSNGVFGIEATSEHIELFGEDIFFSCFKNLKVFHLWRENLVAQAVSLYRAVSTGYFHSHEGTAKKEDPTYNGMALFNWYTYLAHVENGNTNMLINRGLLENSIPITYETMMAAKYQTILKFFIVVGLPIPMKFNMDSSLYKIGDTWNLDIEAQFRSDFPTEINTIENSRLPRLMNLAQK